MQGIYRGAELREAVRREWAALIVPDLMRNEVEPLRRLLPVHTGLVALDVGANKGFWTAALLRAFPGAVSHVHMIDPSPENYAELTNIEDNLMFSADELALVSAHRMAMSAREGVITLHTNEDGSPLASVYPNTMRGFDQSPDWRPASLSYEVPTGTVDAFMAQHGLDHLHILKADVEGHEMSVFEGAASTLSQRRVDVVFFEFGIHQVSSRHFFADFFDLFTGYGYGLWIAEAGVLRPIPHYGFEFENFSRLHNMFAVRTPPPAPAAALADPLAAPAPTRSLLNRLRRRFRAR